MEFNRIQNIQEAYMSFFNIISGIASIASLGLSIWALRRVHGVEMKFGSIHESHVNVKQKANGKDIKQAGRDING